MSGLISYNFGLLIGHIDSTQQGLHKHSAIIINPVTVQNKANSYYNKLELVISRVIGDSSLITYRF